jgi:hypothetical protein
MSPCPEYLFEVMVRVQKKYYSIDYKYLCTSNLIISKRIIR